MPGPSSATSTHRVAPSMRRRSSILRARRRVASGVVEQVERPSGAARRDCPRRRSAASFSMRSSRSPISRRHLGGRVAGDLGEVAAAALADPARRRRGPAAAGRRPAGSSAATSAAPSRPSRGPRSCSGAAQRSLEQLEVGEDAGQRRAQLVRGVGDELALLLHRRLALGARRVEGAEHLLEGAGQLADLVVGRRARACCAEGSRVSAISRAVAVSEAIGRIARLAIASPARVASSGAAEHAGGDEQPEAVDRRLDVLDAARRTGRSRRAARSRG